MKEINLVLKNIKVGTLSFDGSKFYFKYSAEYKDSKSNPLTDFLDINATYESQNLFPFFKARIPSKIKNDVNKATILDDLFMYGKKVVHDPFILA